MPLSLSLLGVDLTMRRVCSNLESHVVNLRPPMGYVKVSRASVSKLRISEKVSVRQKSRGPNADQCSIVNRASKEQVADQRGMLPSRSFEHVVRPGQDGCNGGSPVLDPA